MDAPVPTADWITIRINAGKKQKIRPGDVVGHLTKSPDISGDDIGDIALYDNVIFVAVKRTINKEAYRMLTEHKLKGKAIKSQTLWD